VDARKAGLRWGGYHTFDATKSADQQFSIIKESVRFDADALPFVIDVEGPFPGKSDDFASEVIRLKTLCSQYFRKPAVVYGSRAFFGAYGDALDDKSSIWLARWVRNGKGETADAIPKVAGKIPWTFWQFAGDVEIDGIKGSTDVNAFFGSDSDFTAFARGDEAVAWKAVAAPQ